MCCRKTANIQNKQKKVTNMSGQLDKEQQITIEELVVSHSYEMLALITVLEKKGILARSEIISVINELKKSQ